LLPTSIPYKTFDISTYRDTDYAKMFLELKLPNIITTGNEKNLESYKFNGIYWKSIALHNAEFHKGYFDELYSFLMHQIILFKRAITSRNDYKSPDEMKKFKDDQKIRKTQLMDEQKQKYLEFKKHRQEFETQQKNALKQFNQEKKEFEKIQKDRLKEYENKKKIAHKSNIEFNEIFEKQEWTKTCKHEMFTEEFQQHTYEEVINNFTDMAVLLAQLAKNEKDILVLSSIKSMSNIIESVLKLTFSRSLSFMNLYGNLTIISTGL
jgi:hypothetical protein